MARGWADLPPELLGLCSQHLCLKDLSAFRAVCRSWRSAAVEERSHVPWLMLSHKRGSKQWRKFFCLSCERVHEKQLPEAKARKCFSSRGWVLTVGRDWELHMLNIPTSSHRHVIKLPNLKLFPFDQVEELQHMYPHYINKFVLSDSPTASTDYKVMVVYCHNGRLGLWKPGDEEWTSIGEAAIPYLWIIYDVIFYKGCFLALNYDGNILRCDVDGPTPLEAQEVFQMPYELLSHEQVYLVQSTTGSLLLVSRWGQHNPRTRTFTFRVFEIDLETRSWKEVETLKNTSLFLGRNSSFSLEADEEHRIEPNCIYFTDDFTGGSRLTKDGGVEEMGIYHLEDGSIEPHFKWKSYGRLSPPLWIEP